VWNVKSVLSNNLVVFFFLLSFLSQCMVTSKASTVSSSEDNKGWRSIWSSSAQAQKFFIGLVGAAIIAGETVLIINIFCWVMGGSWSEPPDG